MSNKFKIGDRVRIIREDINISNFIAKIIDLEEEKHVIEEETEEHRILYTILLNNGYKSYFTHPHLKKVPPSIDNMLVGDVLETKTGDQYKVLEVGVNSCLLSRTNNYNRIHNLYSFQELKEYGFKNLGQEEEEIKEVKATGFEIDGGSMNEKINNNNIGKLCPLCKEGVIIYIKYGKGFMNQIEYISCSNDKCNAYVKIIKE